ncbi:restriction endonuclease [Streptomyces sp. SAI-124]|uniref:restriction endonuclease n=1 Tax=Streptomyces sp. SAI-124 TaxID=3377730 RepID=UPI003C7A329D
MSAFDTRKLMAFLRSAQNPANNTAVRGRSYEDALDFLFSQVPGCQVQRNSLNQFKSEEIDLSVSNFREQGGLKMLPEIFLVECKNWSSPVDSATVTTFSSKVRRRGCSVGVLVAASGVTGDPIEKTAAYHQAGQSLAEGTKLLLITSADLSKLTKVSELVDLLHRRYLDLHCAGTFTLA